MNTDTDTKRFQERLAAVARLCKTPTDGTTTLEDWLAEGNTYDGTAADAAAEWDELSGVSSAAALLGRKGGSVRSPRKARASRANGRKGGRKSRKQTTPKENAK